MKKTLIGLCFVSGFFLAGADCDSIVMQLIVNVCGVILFAVSAIAMERFGYIEK